MITISVSPTNLMIYLIMKQLSPLLLFVVAAAAAAATA